ncbi:MAG TPA: hypothetical protein PLC42_05995, partial [Parachlamydiaceae bacterium]|nr:hypothetical protein [Parachlamydiaceae bacterium]
ERSFLVFSKAIKHGIGIQPQVTQMVGATGGKILGAIGALFIRATGFEMNTEKIYKIADERESAKISNLKERTLVVSHFHDALIRPGNRLINASNLNNLSNHEFVDLAEKDVTYSPTAGSLQNLKEVGRLAAKQYDLLSFEEYKAKKEENHQEFQISDYANSLYDFLKQLTKEREEMIAPTSDRIIGEGLKKEIQKEIIELKNMSARVKDTTHNLSFLESKEASAKIFAFVSGRSLNQENETAIVKEKPNDLPVHNPSSPSVQRVDLKSLGDVQDIF